MGCGAELCPTHKCQEQCIDILFPDTGLLQGRFPSVRQPGLPLAGGGGSGGRGSGLRRFGGGGGGGDDSSGKGRALGLWAAYTALLQRRPVSWVLVARMQVHGVGIMGAFISYIRQRQQPDRGPRRPTPCS